VTTEHFFSGVEVGSKSSKRFFEKESGYKYHKVLIPFSCVGYVVYSSPDFSIGRCVRVGEETTEQSNEKENSAESEEEVFIATGVFQDGQIQVTGDGARTLYETGFYGDLKKPELLILGDVEATNLIERKRLEIVDETAGEILPMQAVVDYFAQQNNKFWINYLVYKDLRMRGYIVRIGFEDPLLFRVYPRGGQPGRDPAKLFVAPLPEGKRLALETLEHLFSIAHAARKQLLLAVIDRSGDVTYYRAQQINL